jgi:ribosomal protein S18 acetylase RimI-like enzyme
MIDIEIRFCEISDIPNLLTLMEQLGYPVTEIELKSRFQRFIKNDGYGVTVALKTNKIVGFISWSKSILIVTNQTRFHIEALIVHRDHRGQRIGKKLMCFVEDIARKYRPSIVDLTSGLRRANDGSHEFYKNLGYQNDGPMAKLYLRKEF